MTIWTQPDAAAYSSRDRIAKQLEIEAIAKYIKDGMSVLDVGCGDGETLWELARRFRVISYGFDFSPEMISTALRMPWASAPNALTVPHLWQGDVTSIASFRDQRYDLIYSERCLINLPDWETQKKAIGNIAKALKPGGLYVMCECSWKGLQFINDLREKVGLPRIEPPSHNRYFWDAEIEAYAHPYIEIRSALTGELRDWNHGGVSIHGLRLEDADDYSGTYYFLSRVVNAAVTPEWQEPDYDSQINKLALSLPPIAGLRGQGRVWVWRKS